MLTVQNFTYFKDEKYQLMASLYSATESSEKATIIYLHGGGLIWGQRNDLPEVYIRQFLAAGYNFLSLDYLLAPESDLSEILAGLGLALDWFVSEALTTLELHSTKFCLFGRSAGAYLAYLCGKQANFPVPERLICFYGYATIDAPFYLETSLFYQKYPALSEDLIAALIQKQPIVNGSLETRYGIYLYARQQGCWLDFVLKNQAQLSDYCLTEAELAQLPPTFIAHSNNDQDVPYRIGIDLSLAIPKAKFISIQGLQHDFDYNPAEPQAIEAYQALIRWLG